MIILAIAAGILLAVFCLWIAPLILPVLVFGYAIYLYQAGELFTSSFFGVVVVGAGLAYVRRRVLAEQAEAKLQREADRTAAAIARALAQQDCD